MNPPREGEERAVGAPGALSPLGDAEEASVVAGRTRLDKYPFFKVQRIDEAPLEAHRSLGWNRMDPQMP